MWKNGVRYFQTGVSGSLSSHATILKQCLF